MAFYTSTAEYERHREAIDGLRARTATLQVKLLPDGPLPLLATQAVGGAGVNLLQGPYAPRSTLRDRMREWRLPAALAAAVVLVFFAGQVLAWWKLSRAERALDAQIAEVFSQVLPGQPVVDARAQIEGMLGAGGGAHGGLLPAISVLAQAIAQSPTARLESISFRGNTVELNLTAPSVESLDGITQAMNRAGMTAELQSARPRGQHYHGRLQVRLGQADRTSWWSGFRIAISSWIASISTPPGRMFGVASRGRRSLISTGWCSRTSPSPRSGWPV